MSLRDSMIKLATDNPELRIHLVPILKTAGGTDFIDFIKEPNPDKAFRTLVQKSRFESGHGGYTGTIAEKSDFVIKDRSGLTKDEADDYAYRLVDKNDKWGPAWAVAVVESKDLGIKDVTGTVKAKNPGDARDLATQEIKTKAKLKDEMSLSIKRLDVALTKDGGKVPVTKIDPSSVVPESWGIRTVYPSREVHDTIVYSQHFSSKEQALAEIQNRLSKPDARSRAEGTKIVIYKVTPISGIQVGLAAKLPTWEYKAQVSISQKGKNIIGWVFFGMAST